METGLIDLITGVPAMTMFTNKLLECLPTKEKTVEPEQAVQNVERLRGSDLHRLAPSAAQSLLKQCSKWLSAIVEGREVLMAKGDLEQHTGHFNS